MRGDLLAQPAVGDRLLLGRRVVALVAGRVGEGVAEHLGSDTFLHIHTDGQGTITVRADGDVAVKHGDTVYLTPDAKRLHCFDEQGKALH